MQSFIFKYLNRLGTIYSKPKKIYMAYSTDTFRSSIIQKYIIIHYGILKDNYDDNCTTYCDHIPITIHNYSNFLWRWIEIRNSLPAISKCGPNKQNIRSGLFVCGSSLPKIKCRHHPTMVQHQILS